MSNVNGSERSTDGYDSADVILTVRALMQGKEVGSIIGKKGELVRQLREESGSKIFISDGTVQDRIVTVTGTLDAIYKAFTLITAKVQEYFERQSGNWGGLVPPLTFKLIVPAMQCGSIIGKGGSKIKEIRESSGASIQVSSDMLPNSTERTVTIIGSPESITQCIYQVCLILIESPPRGTVIPYNPHQNVALGNSLQEGLGLAGLGDLGKSGGSNPLAALASLGLGGLSGLAGLTGGGLNAAALAAIASSQLRGGGNKQKSGINVQTQEITVPNEFIGSIIGKGGSKIAEIRHISGAVIRISNNDETIETAEGIKRPITITGTPDAITVAKYLINMSVDLQKANLEAQNQSNSESLQTSSGQGSSSSPNNSTTPSNISSAAAAALPIAQLLSKPTTLTALSSLTALGGLSDLLGTGGVLSNTRPILTTGVHRPKSYVSRNRNTTTTAATSSSTTDSGKNKTERVKFAPY